MIFKEKMILVFLIEGDNYYEKLEKKKRVLKLAWYKDETFKEWIVSKSIINEIPEE